MKDMLLKDTLREIRRSLSRFLSIFFIVAIGVSFFAGVKATCPDMQDTADEYFDRYNLYDIQVLSTYGINESDIEAVRNIEGVENVKGAYSQDTLASIGKDEVVLKVMSMTARGPDEGNTINQFNLIEGRLPENPGECLGEKGKVLDSGMEIGETITLSSGTEDSLSDSLKYDTYTVVGIVETPYYISFERGTTSIGSGDIDYFIMVPEEDFTLPYYTEVYVTVQDAKALGAYTDEYDTLIKKVTETIEPVGEERRKERYDEVIDEAEMELQEQKDKLQEAKDTQDIADAEKKLSNAENQISDIEEPVWYILDRQSNYGAVEFGYTADRMDAIGKVFPVFFFFVAALVCLTTMTRMVDEQRGFIGTLKALGYSKGRITFKYLMYAVAASVLGSVLGFSIGFKLFPTVIFSAYSIMYILPPIKTPFNLKYAAMSTAIATATTTFAAWFACYSELADTPASLMRPKAPKAGKRIFLERITFLWKRLSFTKKITARNLFRYKKRLYMTVFGIAGCTALLLTGFGLKDSIISIVSKQFEELYKYQAIVELNTGIKADDTSSLIDQLNGDDRITGCMLMMNQNVELVEGDTVKSAILSVPEDTEKLKGYIVFRNRKTKEAVPLTDEGAVLTEKLADQLGVKAGDTVYIKDGDTVRLEVKVTGIIENYIHHYIYLSPSAYTRLYNKEPEYTRLVAKTSQTSEEFEKQLSEDIMANHEVQSISLTTGLTESFQETIGSLNYVVLVLIVSAAALAFVVMYNLTNINITERMREIASLKVLGFHDKEVSEYVFRENIFLTLIGIVFGLGFGVFLHKFTVTTAEVNYVMFGRTIKPLSYVYSGVLTMVFSGFVSVVMHFRLKTIGMVESMKSVD